MSCMFEKAPFGVLFSCLDRYLPEKLPAVFRQSYPKNEKLADDRPAKGRSVSVKLNIGNRSLIEWRSRINGIAEITVRGDILRGLKRTLACSSIYARAAALDMVESVSRDATVRKEHWQITGTVEVYGNQSCVAVEVTQQEENCSQLHIKMLSPAPNLSPDGQSRVLIFLADGMEQLLENTFAQGKLKEVIA